MTCTASSHGYPYWQRVSLFPLESFLYPAPQYKMPHQSMLNLKVYHKNDVFSGAKYVQIRHYSIHLSDLQTDIAQCCLKNAVKTAVQCDLQGLTLDGRLPPTRGNAAPPSFRPG